MNTVQQQVAVATVQAAFEKAYPEIVASIEPAARATERSWQDDFRQEALKEAWRHFLRLGASPVTAAVVARVAVSGTKKAHEWLKEQRKRLRREVPLHRAAC